MKISKLGHNSNDRNQAVGIILMGALTLFWRSSSYKTAFDLRVYDL